MILGKWRLDGVSGGNFMLDGGAMFGVTPKSIWSKLRVPDAENRLLFTTRCVLARDGERVVLVETGYGGKLTPREREIFVADEGEPLVEGLAKLGVDPGQVDTVALSHLHFDHVGGATRVDAKGHVTPTFPNARHIVQRGEWEVATSGAPELRASYPRGNLAPLEAAGALEFLDGAAEILPGLRAIPTPGHTKFHQSLIFESGGETAVFVGDLCPTTSHLRSLWCMAYDVYPLETRRVKPAFLGQAADSNWWLLWDHDPDLAACRLKRDERREFVVVDPLKSL